MGLALVIIGLLLFLLTVGALHTIGLILLIIGIVALVVGFTGRSRFGGFYW